MIDILKRRVAIDSVSKMFGFLRYIIALEDQLIKLKEEKILEYDIRLPGYWPPKTKVLTTNTLTVTVTNRNGGTQCVRTLGKKTTGLLGAYLPRDDTYVVDFLPEWQDNTSCPNNQTV